MVIVFCGPLTYHEKDRKSLLEKQFFAYNSLSFQAIWHDYYTWDPNCLDLILQDYYKYNYESPRIYKNNFLTFTSAVSIRRTNITYASRILSNQFSINLIVFKFAFLLNWLIFWIDIKLIKI